MAQLNDKYTQKERVNEKEAPKKLVRRQCESVKEEGESDLAWLNDKYTQKGRVKEKETPKKIDVRTV